MKICSFKNLLSKSKSSVIHYLMLLCINMSRVSNLSKKEHLIKISEELDSKMDSECRHKIRNTF